MPVKRSRTIKKTRKIDSRPYRLVNLSKPRWPEVLFEEEVRRFGKVTSTRLARFELIPKSALIALADRFELGIERKKDGAWNAASQANVEVLQDKAFVIERLSHCIHHCYDAIKKLVLDCQNEGEEDAGAILFAGAVLAEYKGIGKKE